MNGCLISTVENWTTMDVYSAFMNSNCAMNAYYEWVRGYDVAAEWLGACIQEEPVPTPTDSIAVPVEPSPNP
ncbi:MAG: hypothetical protein EOO95_08420 [Pedobacter sp.]|nr:MAG: hypothetical protein EOO95_08420 [Pedobacter sp.]